MDSEKSFKDVCWVNESICMKERETDSRSSVYVCICRDFRIKSGRQTANSWRQIVRLIVWQHCVNVPRMRLCMNDNGWSSTRRFGVGVCFLWGIVGVRMVRV